jgi:ATP-dependent protease HslVU (ClpYQ) peptidase subunit
MTTIIAKETNNRVEIAFDSLCTGYNGFQLEQKKVFVNNGIIFGVAGRLLIATELKYADLPKPPQNPAEVEKWLTSRLVPKVRQILNEIAPRRGDDGFGMQILVVVHNKVYEISGDTGWHRREDGLYSVGSGSPYALGVLAAGGSVSDALRAADYHDSYTGAELFITTADALLAQADKVG